MCERARETARRSEENISLLLFYAKMLSYFSLILISRSAAGVFVYKQAAE